MLQHNNRESRRLCFGITANPCVMLKHNLLQPREEMTTHTPVPALMQPEELTPAVELAGRALAQMDQVLLGRSQLHRMVLSGILSRGHILLEGLPGVGKTAMIKALGQIL